MPQSAPTRRHHEDTAVTLDPMTEQDRLLRARLGSAAIVVAGLLAIVLLIQTQGEADQLNVEERVPVQLGRTPVTSVACAWVDGTTPTRLNPVGVLEATVS